MPFYLVKFSKYYNSDRLYGTVVGFRQAPYGFKTPQEVKFATLVKLLSAKTGSKTQRLPTREVWADEQVKGMTEEEIDRMLRGYAKQNNEDVRFSFFRLRGGNRFET